VIPEEILPQVRKNLHLPIQLPEENIADFGQIMPESELETAIQQIPEMSLKSPSSDDVFEMQLKKDTGKKSVLQILSIASFRDLHMILQDFAGDFI
jgi:hypothetical protein